MLAALNVSLIHFLKLRYDGAFTYITQIVNSNAHDSTLTVLSLLNRHFFTHHSHPLLGMYSESQTISWRGKPTKKIPISKRFKTFVS